MDTPTDAIDQIHTPTLPVASEGEAIGCPTMSSADLLDNLTPEQARVVQHVDGPILVLAGPGSGKTTVVTRRIATLILEHGIPPWQILALTFTNKAAGEMKQRVLQLLPDESHPNGPLPGMRGLTISTFHSFCVRLLRRYAAEAGVPERFTLYDASDQRDAIKKAIEKCGLSTKNWPPASVGSAISNAKNRLRTPEQMSAESGDFYQRSVAKAYAAYQDILRANDALDFDDLLMATARMLRANQSVREELQSRYQYVMIDEYQDTNHSQFVIAQSMAASHQNLCVVGDPDQSIYGWRGADIQNILQFEEQFPATQVIPLGRNFRSTGHIVQAASFLIGHNKKRKDKELSTDLEDGHRPSIVMCGDEHHEARLICEEFSRLQRDEELPWRKMAVLYRINSLSRVLEEAFRTAQIPYVIARGTAFYDRKEVKDALAYLRVIANPNDDISLMRIANVPARGIGRTTLQRVEAYAQANGLTMLAGLRQAGRVEGIGARSMAAVKSFVMLIDAWQAIAGNEVPDTALGGLVDRVVRESGLEKFYKAAGGQEDEDRLANLGELVTAAGEFQPADDVEVGPLDGVDQRSIDDGDTSKPRTLLDRLRDFLESVTLVADADSIDPESGAVTLMTLHTAKGLEFSAVALAGLEQGVLPHACARESEAELEEERRLCFVGMTRAERHLMLTSAALRTQRGIRERTIPSQFLNELPTDHVATQDQSHAAYYEDDVDWGYTQTAESKRRPAASKAKATPFGVGSLVRHPVFGVGRIESLTPRPHGSAARISFRSAGTKTLIVEYAKLELIGE